MLDLLKDLWILYEGAQEILADTDYYHNAAAGNLAGVDSGVGGGTVYLHFILTYED